MLKIKPLTIKGGWNKIKSFFGGNGEGDKAARIIGGGFGSNDYLDPRIFYHIHQLYNLDNNKPPNIIKYKLCSDCSCMEI